MAELKVDDLRVTVGELLSDMLRQAVGRVLFAFLSFRSLAPVGPPSPVATNF